jgi:anti-anti-sigma factor
MEMKTSTQKGITVIEISGSLDSNTTQEAQDKITPMVTSKCCFVLDLTKCTYISSAGLRLLLMLAKQLTAQEGRLALAGLCAEIMDVMETTGFSCFFKCYPSMQQAIDSV